MEHPIYGSAGHGQISILKKIQKKVVRNVKGVAGRAHTNNIFMEFGILKVRDLIEYNRRVFGYGIWYNKLPENIRSDFERVSTVGAKTRAIEKLSLKEPFCKKKIHESAPCVTIPSAWNCLETTTKSINKIGAFKNKLCKLFFEKYRNEPKCSRTHCYSCAWRSGRS